MERHQQLIDQIYAAALDASGWSLVMESMEQKFGCIASGIYTAHPYSGRVSLTELRGIDAELLETYIAHFLLDNPWQAVPSLQRQGCVRTDASLDRYYKQPGFYHKTELYNDWMKPQDFIHTLGVNLYVDSHSQTKCFLYRPRQMGAFSTHDVARFKWIAGHLANAVCVARRLSIQRSMIDDLQGVVDRMALGVVFLDPAGHILQANRFAEALLGRHDGVLTRESRVAASHRKDQGKLNGAMRCALAARYGDTPGAAHMVSLRRPDGKQPLCAILVPLSCGDSGPFLMEKAAVALILNDPECDSLISTDWLRQRFQFNSTEARLAQDLSRGCDLRQAAGKAGITYQTARWYLKGIFQKTGVDRQAELVRLLLSEQIMLRQHQAR
ncbi:helix-turn-helix transcriptional regulator [Sedimenticola hydrogenitrophicus]|uniref:helix-turn-helix transcriptional regulator n=1 Tax=Sedimenticola hydrogenitrophicus TaxID=2967975 RepID=UPI0023AF7DAB|nr:hypothetical protein [Sedimenticola hydrogenitrophicus]